jgi:hypothetical protein
MLHLRHGRLSVPNEYQIHATIDAPAAAYLPHLVPMAAEGVGNDLLELLPAERGEVTQRALVAELARPSDAVDQRHDDHDGARGHPDQQHELFRHRSASWQGCGAAARRRPHDAHRPGRHSLHSAAR